MRSSQAEIQAEWLFDHQYNRIYDSFNIETARLMAVTLSNT